MTRWMTVVGVVGLVGLVVLGGAGGSGWKDEGPHADCMPDSDTKATLRIEGSTTCGPIADAFAEAFTKQCPDLRIAVRKTGSGNGMGALIAGRCDAALMSRPLKASEFRLALRNGVLPCGHVVAMDSVAVVVHPTNPVEKLTVQQVQQIYTGQITNWKQLCGRYARIVPISRDASSGTFETFSRLVMRGRKISGIAEVGASPKALARITSASIGYVGLGFVDEKVKALTIDGVRPSKCNVTSGQYPVSRRLFLVTNGWPAQGTPLRQFVMFHLTRAGEGIIRAKGFVPLVAPGLEKKRPQEKQNRTPRP